MKSIQYVLRFKTGDPFPLIRNLNLRDSTLWSSLVSVDLASDEISATGGRQRLGPFPAQQRIDIAA